MKIWNKCLDSYSIQTIYIALMLKRKNTLKEITKCKTNKLVISYEFNLFMARVEQ